VTKPKTLAPFASSRTSSCQPSAYAPSPALSSRSESALLSLLGDKVDRPRIPFLHRLRRPTQGSRFWGAIIKRVLRRPVVSLVLGVGALLGLAASAIGMTTANVGVTDYSKNLPVMQSYDRFEKAFPGGPGPAEVVVEAADVTAPDVTGAIASLKTLALATGEMHEPFDVQVNPAKNVAVVEFGLDGTGTDAVTRRALTTLRGSVVPQAFGTLEASGAARVAVTGDAATGFDFNDQVVRAAPVVFAFVLVLAFVLLLVSFRSIVVALKAIVLNLLSVGAAYGSRRPARSRPGCRCSCSRCCSACRWTATCWS
jgi:putative drug exporter of the RND superfamily